MSQRPLDVDRLAADLFNRAAIIAGGMGDEGEALQLCRDLGVIEQSYALVLKTELFASRAAPSRGRTATVEPAKFAGRPIITKFNGRCAVCGGPYLEGAEVLWANGAGAAHLACGEVAA